MEGLLGQAPAGPAPAAPQAPQQAPQAAPQAAPEPQGAGAPPGEIDEARFSEATRVASQALYDEKVWSRLMEMAVQNPIPAIANTVVAILTDVDKAIPGMVIDEVFGVGMAMVVDAADAVQQSGVEVSEEQVNDALSDAITMFLEQNPQRFTQEELQDGVQRLQASLAELPEEQGGMAGPPQGAQAGLMGGA